MGIERYIEIDNTKYFKKDIETMTKRQINEICAFLTNRDLLWVRLHCRENAKILIDTILFKL